MRPSGGATRSQSGDRSTPESAGRWIDDFYGVSDNDRSRFDVDHAHEVLEYDPEDDGEEWDAPPGEPSAGPVDVVVPRGRRSSDRPSGAAVE